MLVHMEMTDSSVLTEVRWETNDNRTRDAENIKGLLSVTFVNGRTYEYSNVPLWHLTDMMLSESRGAYFTAFIRDKYTARRAA